jgi:hypothetical protein
MIAKRIKDNNMTNKASMLKNDSIKTLQDHNSEACHKPPPSLKPFKRKTVI